MIPKISLEQWAAFKAVVDEGSFAKAAEALNKSQSAVSYAIAKLEEQLPTPVLTQQGRRAAPWNRRARCLHLFFIPYID